jgi:hypothetical protein
VGTSNSFGGGGGKPGRDLREDISDWLASLPNTPSVDKLVDPAKPVESQQPAEQRQAELPKIPQESVLNVISMFRPRSTGGGGGATGGAASGGGNGSGDGRQPRGGAQRSATRSASAAGRAAAAAYALRTGDAAALRTLGLDYDQLQANSDPVDVARRIVAAACGPLSDGTIEDEERRMVAAELAQWVLEANAGGVAPQPDEIVREAITLILFEAATTETAAELRNGKRPAWATQEGERQIRECAAALAENAELSPQGPTVEEFQRAIERGIETLRGIWETS